MADTTLSFASPTVGFRRGDYITLSGAVSSVATSGGLARITAASATVCTVRPLSRFRVVEWCRVRVEDWIAWPLADLRSRFRFAVKS